MAEDESPSTVTLSEPMESGTLAVFTMVDEWSQGRVRLRSNDGAPSTRPASCQPDTVISGSGATSPAGVAVFGECREIACSLTTTVSSMTRWSPSIRPLPW